MKATVGGKIGIGFFVVCLVFLIVGFIAFQSVNKLTDTADWVEHTHQVRETLDGIIQASVDAETGVRGYILTSQDTYLEPYNSGLAVVQKDVKDVRDLTVDNPTQQHNMDVLDPLIKQHLDSLTEGMETLKNQGTEAGRQWVLTGKSKKEMDQIRLVIAQMKDEEARLLKIRTAEAQSSAGWARAVIIAGTLLAIIFSSLAGYFLSRNIAGPLRTITMAAEKIAVGDLDVNIVSNHRADEVGVLARTFAAMTQSMLKMADVARKIADGDLRVNVQPQSAKDRLGNAFSNMVDNLRRMTGQISEGVLVLTSSAGQISTSTTQLAASATETATAVSQATTTVEEVRQTAQLSSQKSRLVSDSAQKMAQISQSGSKSTEETVTGMNHIRSQMQSVADTMVRLSEQGQTIGQIVATVEDLAAQSNLLAVNASIEAAKAGDQGKGFVIVAQEVRNLAEQSRQATNQVRGILSDIQKATSAAVMATEQGTKAVESGVKQSASAGQSIVSLTSSVQEAASAATQIAASSQQQLVGMDQVASAMENIKQASTQNVASAKQLETAAHSLKELGQKLKQVVEQYRI